MRLVGQGMHVTRNGWLHYQGVVIVGNSVSVRCGFRRERSAWRWAVDIHEAMTREALAAND